VDEGVGNYSAGRERPLAGLFYWESGLPKRRLSAAEFNTKLSATENPEKMATGTRQGRKMG